MGCLAMRAGLRYVSQEEDQVRWENAQVLALHQLQDRLHFHPRREKAQPAQGVCLLCSVACCVGMALTARFRAKYIEGLENRLGRMESLLRLSGLLSEDDGGKTDLGTLEKRLADRSVVNEPSSSTNRFNVPNTSQQTSTSRQSTPRMESHSSPRTAPTSPEPQKESENEVEGLSDMMCSLVTSNSGETRYIGNFATTC